MNFATGCVCSPGSRVASSATSCCSELKRTHISFPSPLWKPSVSVLRKRTHFAAHSVPFGTSLRRPSLRRVATSAAQVPNPGEKADADKTAGGASSSSSKDTPVVAGASDSAGSAGAEETGSADSAAGSKTDEAETKGWWGKLVAWCKKPTFDKEKIVKMGTSAVLAYGFVSNVNAFILIIISWKIFTVKTGLSPLTQGQWGPYLLTYTALYAVFGNLLRPVRIGISAALSPYFNKLVMFFKEKFKVNQGVALGLTVFLVNGCLGIGMLVSGLLATSVLTGMPLLPTPVAA